MPREPGQAVYGDERRVTFVSDGSGSPGDWVALDSASGQVTTSDGTNNPKFTGVISDSKDNKEGFEAGEKVSVIVDGIVVAKVAAGTSAGADLGPSATEGEATSGGSSAETFSGEGGEFNGPIPDGYAAAHLGGS